MQLNSTSYVILGMIRLGRRTGYEIKQLVDFSTRFFWAASYGQIYPELKRLEEAGLITGEDEPTGGRQRRAYSLTPAGEDALHDWLTSDTNLVYEVRDEGLLRFFFADEMTAGEAVNVLRRMRAQHEAIVAQLEEIEPVAAQGPNRFPHLTARFGIDFHKWIASWCTEMERKLAEEGAADVHQAR
jgi:PadR family transcriptional regulator, regulatory protein AphA